MYSDGRHALVLEFGWGGFTPQQVQEIASLLKRDREQGADMNLLDELAALGADGTVPGNCARDLNRHIPPTRLPPPRYHRIPCRHKVVGRGRPLLPFIYPHEMFAHLYHEYPSVFFTRVAPPGEAERFWDEVKGGPGQGILFLKHPNRTYNEQFP
jgi:hypothetical protein